MSSNRKNPSVDTEPKKIEREMDNLVRMVKCAADFGSGGYSPCFFDREPEITSTPRNNNAEPTVSKADKERESYTDMVLNCPF